MKSMLAILLLALLTALPAAAHGGVYIGPGDVVPPGAKPPAVDPPPDAPPAVTPPNQPPAVTPPGFPPPGETPLRPVPPPLNPRNPAVITPPGSLDDLNSWVYWWEINKGPFLQLRARVHSAGATTTEATILEGLVQGGVSAPVTSAPEPAQIRLRILPRIMQELQGPDDRDLIGSALMAAARIRRDQAGVTGDQILPFLASRDQEVAEVAALSLGVLGDPGRIPVLVALLEDDASGRLLVRRTSGVPARTRVFAAYGLALLAPQQADPTTWAWVSRALLRCYQQDDSAFRDLRVACLIGLGMVPVEDPSGRVAQLLALLDDMETPALVRAHAPTALAKVLEPFPGESALRQQVLERFAAHLGSRNSANEMRQSCAQALALLCPPRADIDADHVLDLLTHALLKDKDQQTRNYAAISLGYLAAYGPDGSPVSDQAVRTLLHEMRKGRSTLRPWCGLALGVASFEMRKSGGLHSPQIERALHEAFREEKSPQRRAAYAVALGLLQAKSAAPDLAAELHQGDATLRGYCALALGMMDARSFQADLVAVVEASRRRPQLLRQASVGLGLMGDKSAIPLLLRDIHPPDGKRPSLSVLAAAATALGYLGDRSAVEPLLATLDDHRLTPLSRAFALISLGLVAAQADLPWNTEIARGLNYRAAVTTLTNQQSGILDIR